MLISRQVVHRQFRSFPSCVCTKEFSDVAVKKEPKKPTKPKDIKKKAAATGSKKEGDILQKFMDAAELCKR